MTAMVQNGQGPPPLPDGTAQIDPAMVTNALLNALEQAKQRAAAPTPRKKLTVRRDGSNRMTGIDQEG
jgi:hypothetical protein